VSLPTANEIAYMHLIPPVCELSASTAAPRSVWREPDHIAARNPRYQRASAVVKALLPPIPSLERLTTTHLPCYRELLGIVVEVFEQPYSSYLESLFAPTP
jgi:hypothetical protein